MTTARAAALAWVVAAVATVGVEVWAGVRSPVPYSFAEQAISDLGATRCGPVDTYPDGPVEVCSPAHDVVNAVWIVAGLLLAAAAAGLRGRLGRARSGRVAVVLVALGGLLQAAVGAVPADVDLVLHAVVGVTGFVVQAAALVASGVALRRHDGALGVLALAGAVLTLVGTVLLFAPTAWGLPFGVLERVAVYPFLAWVAVAGAAWTAPGPAGERG